MTDADLLLDVPGLEFGSGVIGVCDVCRKRQAVIVLSKERYKLCVIDFLNKKWTTSTAAPGAPLPPYRSERVVFPTLAYPSGVAAAVVLRPTKAVRRPSVLLTPEVYGLTTATLDAGIRLARDGYEVLLPDLDRSGATGPTDHLALRWERIARGGISPNSPGVGRLMLLYADALAYLRSEPLADPSKSAVVGLSYGASLAALLATREQRLTAVALASPLPVRPPEIVRLITAPTWISAGQKDGSARRALAQLQREMPADRLTVFDPGRVSHGYLARDLRDYDLAAAEATWTALSTFLRGRLMPPLPKPLAPPVVNAQPASPVVAS